LGGVDIESDVGPVGHSDGDAILHALCDAVLGAAGRSDLGTLFPDSDAANKDRDSGEFCAEARRQLAGEGFAILSLDVVLEAQRPKLIPHRAAMRERIAMLFGIDLDCVNVRGKTAEGLGAIGRGEAIRATAVALLEKS
jgi:2-C-methyl-D-erythritol 2,4-cyclodiphosphate synthase